jgi:NAD(P)H-flavin reductase
MTALAGGRLRYQRIERVLPETKDTFTFVLPSGAETGPAFLPGQFNMLYVHGIGEVPISISGDPANSGRFTHTTRAVGSVTGAMASLRKGDLIGVRGPFGRHWPVREAEGNDLLLIAGGIGLAPLRPALYHALANRDRYGKVILLYGARSPEEMLYRKELEGWRARFDVDVEVTVDYAAGNWRGNVGFVTNLIHRMPFDPGNSVAMICGPEVMMRFAAHELLRRGMSDSNIHISLERNMKCALGTCGHCQFGPYFVCKDGPVFPFAAVSRWLALGEI